MEDGDGTGEEMEQDRHQQASESDTHENGRRKFYVTNISIAEEIIWREYSVDSRVTRSIYKRTTDVLTGVVKLLSRSPSSTEAKSTAST